MMRRCPSSNSVAAMNLLRLGRMTGNPEFEKQGRPAYEVIFQAGCGSACRFYTFHASARFRARPRTRDTYRRGFRIFGNKGDDRYRSPALLPKPGADAQRQWKARRGFVGNRAVYRADNFRRTVRPHMYAKTSVAEILSAAPPSWSPCSGAVEQGMALSDYNSYGAIMASFGRKMA